MNAAALTLATLLLAVACKTPSAEDHQVPVAATPEKRLDCLHGICLEDTPATLLNKGCARVAQADRYPDYLWTCPSNVYWATTRAFVSPTGKVAEVVQILTLPTAPEQKEAAKDYIEKATEAIRKGEAPPWEERSIQDVLAGRGFDVMGEVWSETHMLLKEQGWVSVNPRDANELCWGAELRDFREDPAYCSAYQHPTRVGWLVWGFKSEIEGEKGAVLTLRHPLYTHLMNPTLDAAYGGLSR
jgi:hypothetical protein